LPHERGGIAAIMMKNTTRIRRDVARHFARGVVYTVIVSGSNPELIREFRTIWCGSPTKA
jgi:hypothetical protein